MSVTETFLLGHRVRPHAVGWVVLCRTGRSGWWVAAYTFSRTREGAIAKYGGPDRYKAAKDRGRARAVRCTLEAVLLDVVGAERKVVE